MIQTFLVGPILNLDMLTMDLRLLVGFCLILTQNVVVSSQQIWAQQYILDGQGNVQLSWSTHGQEITFELSVRTLGYIAMGLSPNGGMAGSDIAIGWVKDGQVYLQDRFAEGEYLPVLDKIQNWELLNGYENGTHTVLQFKRNLTTCDPQDREINSQTQRVIYAYSRDDPKSLDKIKYHGFRNRGVRSLRFLQQKREVRFEPEKDKDLKYWDATAKNFSIPSDDTTYWCKIVKIPPLGKKHHIIRVVKNIQPGSEPYVHHMTLHNCHNADPKELEEQLNSEGYFCYHPKMPEVFKKCNQQMVSWVIGGEDGTYPEHVGVPIGEDDTTYFLLEMHYDNSPMHSGVVDNSGLRVYYTPNLRQYDAQTAYIGSNFDDYIQIPPGRKRFKTIAHCSTDCLSQALPPEGVKIFAMMYHMHLTGKEMVIRHFRNGTELPPLGVEKNYDFNYQEYEYYPERTLLPGDHLTVECIFDTSEKSEITFGGFSTQEEMCLAMPLFYPKVKMGGCFSSPMRNAVLGLSGVQEIDPIDHVIKSPQGLSGQSYREYMKSQKWSESYVDALEEVWTNGPHQQECYDGTGGYRPIPFSITYPKIDKPYVEVDTCSKE